MVFGIIPECRSASIRNERSASPESPNVAPNLILAPHPAIFSGILCLNKMGSSDAYSQGNAHSVNEKLEGGVRA
jgi:hypothetical protein